jgi:hypothetical protein
MGTRRPIVVLALLLVIAAGLAAGAGAEVVQSGNLRVSFHASFAPHALPRERPAPISIEVEGKILTTDGSQPPPLKRLRVELSRAGLIDTRGLSACKASTLQSTSSDQALERCGAAQVGHGTFKAQLEISGRPIPVNGRALVFNGVVAGSPGMLIHIFIARPVRLTMVVPLRITKQKGEFGTVLSTTVPNLAGGFGSVTELRLRIGRKFAYGGRQHSYLSAACAAPAGFSGGVFAFARGAFEFTEGRTMHAVLTRNCQVRKSAESG